MKLSYDIARCAGYWNLLPFGKQLDTVCIDCARRTSPGHPKYQWSMEGAVVDGVCVSKIKDEK